MIAVVKCLMLYSGIQHAEGLRCGGAIQYYTRSIRERALWVGGGKGRVLLFPGPKPAVSTHSPRSGFPDCSDLHQGTKFPQKEALILNLA